MEKGKVGLGLFVIVIGLFIILVRLNLLQFSWDVFWPLFILVPGLLFQVLFFSRLLPSGVLIPGGILTTYGVLFFVCTSIGWNLITYLWPTFILGVAIGLWEFYVFSRDQSKGTLTAALILTIIAGVFYGFTLLQHDGVYLIALGLIAAGLFIMFSGRRRN